LVSAASAVNIRKIVASQLCGVKAVHLLSVVSFHLVVKASKVSLSVSETVPKASAEMDILLAV
jgi:hypothetical protein